MAKGRLVGFKTKKKSKSRSKKGKKGLQGQEERINRGLEEICNQFSLLNVEEPTKEEPREKRKSKKQIKREDRKQQRLSKSLCKLLKGLSFSETFEDDCESVALKRVKERLPVQVLNPSEVTSDDFLSKQREDHCRYKKIKSRQRYCKKARRNKSKGASYRFLKDFGVD